MALPIAFPHSSPFPPAPQQFLAKAARRRRADRRRRRNHRPEALSTRCVGRSACAHRRTPSPKPARRRRSFAKPSSSGRHSVPVGIRRRRHLGGSDARRASCSIRPVGVRKDLRADQCRWETGSGVCGCTRRQQSLATASNRRWMANGPHRSGAETVSARGRTEAQRGAEAYLRCFGRSPSVVARIAHATFAPQHRSTSLAGAAGAFAREGRESEGCAR